MLGPHAHADEACRELPQPRPCIQQPHEAGRLGRLHRGQCGRQHEFLRHHLKALNDLGGELPPLLDLLEVTEGRHATPQHRRQNVGRRHCVLDGEVDANAADGRHRMGGVTDAKKPGPRPFFQPVHCHGQKLDLVEVLDRFVDAARGKAGDRFQAISELGQAVRLDGVEAALGDQIGALPVIGAIDHHEQLAVPHLADQVGGIARQHRQAQPQHVERRAQVVDLQAGLVAQGGMAAISGDGHAGLDLNVTARSARQHAADAIAHLAVFLRDQVLGFGLHQQVKVGQLFALRGQEIQEIPLRHQGDELGGSGQPGKIADGEMLIPDLDIAGANAGVGQLEEFLQQAQLMHHLEGGGMYRVAAEIAQEVLVLFQHRDVHPGPGQQIAAHHPGRATARDQACGGKRFQVYPLERAPCPCRALV